MGFDLTMRGSPGDLPDAFPGKADGHPEWYRLSPHGMALMAAILHDLGVLVPQEAPSLPTWPPRGLTQERAEAVDGGGDATSEERAAYEEWKRSHEAAASTRSSAGVPSFKFASNENWIVQPEECLAIAAALKGCRVDEAFASYVRQIDAEINDAVREALAAEGYDAPPRAELSMSVPELAKWLTDFAVWNECAATVGGYTVS